MPGKVSPTLRVLIEIRDEVRGTNARVDGLTARVDGLTARFDGLAARVDGLTARVESLENTMHQLAPAVFETVRILKRRDDLRDRVEDHERRLATLEHRAG